MLSSFSLLWEVELTFKVSTGSGGRWLSLLTEVLLVLSVHYKTLLIVVAIGLAYES